MLNLGEINQPKMQEVELEDVVEPTTDDILVLNNLIAIRDTIKDCSNPAVACEVFDHDPQFYAAFSQTGDTLTNLDHYIEASMEGKLQDFLRFGLSGLVAGLYYSSLSRIRKICEQYRNSTDVKVEDKTSLYLPDYFAYTQLIKKIDMLFEACVKFQKDPKADVKTIVDALRKGGANVGYNGSVQDLVSTDWKAVAGTWIGELILGGIFRLPVLGSVLGAHVASDQGGKISNRGWDVGKIAQAAGQIADRIDKVYELKNMKPNVNSDDPELGAKLHFAANAYKVYLDVLKNVGRGVASAFTIIR